MVEKKSYEKYREEVREDFYQMCGYCGKSEEVTKNAFELDHFIPKSLAPWQINDYDNLVYSCFVCNRKKGNKWASKDPDIQFVNGEGFVDPASDAYDEHLERNGQGEIVAKTEIGRYMAERVFRFSLRPMKEIWKAMQLIEKKELLREKWETLLPEEKERYIVLDQTIQELQKLLFEKRE